MTGYTVHTGSSEKFSEGWDQIFQQTPKKKSAKKTESPAETPAAIKKTGTKKTTNRSKKK